MTTTQRQKERETAVIRAPHDGSEVGVVALAGPEDVRAALDANVAPPRASPDMPAYARPAATKIAPAMACGATTTLKPPPQDPLTTLRLFDLVGASGYPEGAANVVPCHVEVAQILIEDPRVRLITFTGSAKAGWAIRAKAGTKRVALELGGNAAVIVEPDADLAWAAARCAIGGFTYAGQSCISTQRIFVQERVYQTFLDLLLEKEKQLKVGDVLDDHTDVGPMISAEAAERVERWIKEATSAGAKIVVGGKRNGVFLQPTVLTHTTADMKVNCEEVFAPLVTVTPYRSLNDAIAWANATPYGLQAGVFTTNLQTMFRLHAELDVGAVNGNDIPGFRVDRLPYGGAKASGQGREGVRYAIEEMTERRVLTLKLD